MKDGWEVSWGLLALDPSDAALDPDGDRVTNLRESQLNTNPTGVYRVQTLVTADDYQPSIVSANDLGHVIHTGPSTYDQEPIVIGVDWFEQKGTYSYLHSQPAASSASGGISRFLMPSIYVSRNNSSWSRYEYQSETPQHYLEALTGNIHSGVQGYAYTYNSNNGVYDYQQYAYLIPSDLRELGRDQWINWESIQTALRDPAAGFGIAPLAAQESISFYTTAVSSSGTRRVHGTSMGRQLLLNERGSFISDLGSQISWQKFNDEGHAFAIVTENHPAANGQPAQFCFPDKL